MATETFLPLAHVTLDGNDTVTTVLTAAVGITYIVRGIRINNISDTDDCEVILYRGGQDTNHIWLPKKTIQPNNHADDDTYFSVNSDFGLYAQTDLASSVVVWVDGMRLS